MVLNDTIAGMKATDKLSAIVNDLFLRDRRPIISLVLISQSYLKVPKTIRLSATHYFILKIRNTTNFNK